MIPKSKLKSLVGKKIWYVEEQETHCDCPHCEGCGDPEEAVQVKLDAYIPSDDYVHLLRITPEEDYYIYYPTTDRCFLTKKEALAFIKKSGESDNNF